MKYYKVLDKGGKPYNGGRGRWSLPRGGRPGKWMPPLDDLIACQRGYHVCRKKDLVLWLGPTLWLCETQGPHLRCNEKVVATSARLIRRFPLWNERTARLFAADCAERVLPVFLKTLPNDTRPTNAIVAARQLAFGKITKNELAAAGAAARDAAWNGARDGAWDGAWTAAWAAAGAAARDAAWNGAGAAAWDGAWTAARAAAGAAARDAAWNGAGAAAWNAAWNGERRWQTRRLFLYLDDKVDIKAIKAKAAADWTVINDKGVGR